MYALLHKSATKYLCIKNTVLCEILMVFKQEIQVLAVVFYIIVQKT